MFHIIDLKEILSTFLVMFAIIDITGSIPIFVSMRDKGTKIKPFQATGAALLLFIGFYFLGDALLHLFGIDMPSFAVAGSVVLFILAFEMVLGRDIIKNEPTSSGASIVPIAFPLIAGPGAITAFISLHAEYETVNFFVLRYLEKITHWLGADIIYVLRKFFGVILLAMAVKLFAGNIMAIFHG